MPSLQTALDKWEANKTLFFRYEESMLTAARMGHNDKELIDLYEKFKRTHRSLITLQSQLELAFPRNICQMQGVISKTKTGHSLWTIGKY